MRMTVVDVVYIFVRILLVLACRIVMLGYMLIFGNEFVCFL